MSLPFNETAYYKIKTKNSDTLSEFPNQAQFGYVPQNLVATSNGTHLVISWVANTRPDLDGYYVYRSID